MTDWYNLPEEARFENLISILNHDIRNVTLGFVLNKNFQFESDIQRGFTQTVDPGSGVQIPRPASFGEYCHSASQIGMVAEERFRKRGYTNTPAWRLTEAGERIGVPSARHAVRTANQFNLSMYQVFGPLQSSGKTRGPYNAARILSELDEEMRIADLEEKLEIDDSGIVFHLKRMEKICFVEFESRSPEIKGMAKYEWVRGKPEDAKPPYGMPTLTLDVAQCLFSSGAPMDYRQIGKQLNVSASPISSVLTELEKQGLARRLSEFKSRQNLSRVSRSSVGTKFTQDFILPIRETSRDTEPTDNILQSYDHLENFQSALEQSTKASVLYCHSSPNFNNLPKEERKAQLRGILKREGRMKPKDIAKAMGVVSCAHLLTELADEGIVKRVDKNSATYHTQYELVE